MCLVLVGLFFGPDGIFAYSVLVLDFLLLFVIDNSFSEVMSVREGVDSFQPFVLFFPVFLTARRILFGMANCQCLLVDCLIDPGKKILIVAQGHRRYSLRAGIAQFDRVVVPIVFKHLKPAAGVLFG